MRKIVIYLYVWMPSFCELGLAAMQAAPAAAASPTASNIIPITVRVRRCLYFLSNCSMRSFMFIFILWFWRISKFQLRFDQGFDFPDDE